MFPGEPVCTHAILSRLAFQALDDAALLSGAGKGADDSVRP